MTKIRHALRRFEDERTDEGSAFTFEVIVEADVDDGGYVAHFVEMPGIASEGETQAEAIENVTEAWGEVLAARLASQIPAGEPSQSPLKLALN